MQCVCKSHTSCRVWVTPRSVENISATKVLRACVEWLAVGAVSLPGEHAEHAFKLKESFGMKPSAA